MLKGRQELTIMNGYVVHLSCTGIFDVHYLTVSMAHLPHLQLQR